MKERLLLYINKFFRLHKKCFHFSVRFKISLPRRLPPMFSSRVLWFHVFHLKSLIHSELSFVYGVTWWSIFILFAYGCAFFLTPIIEDLLFFVIYSWLLCYKSVVCMCVGLFLGSQCCSIGLSVFLPIRYSFNCYSFVV